MDQSTLDSLGGYGELAISYSLDFIGAILLLVGGWLVARWVSRVLRRHLDDIPGMDLTLVGVVASLARYTVLIAAYTSGERVEFSEDAAQVDD